MKTPKCPKFKKLVFTNVDPRQGMVRFALMGAPEGYAFYKLDRKGTKAVITYVRLDK